MMAVRISRRRLTNWAQNPKSQRSAVRRLGARRRERCRKRSCCFKSIFSASTARVPPVPRRTASLANRCTITKIAFFMDKQLAQHRTQEQGSRIAAAAHLNYEFAMYRRGFLDAGGSHSLQEFVDQVAAEIRDPETGTNALERSRAKMLVDASDKNGGPAVQEIAKRLQAGEAPPLGALGSGSDYTPFLQHLGMPVRSGNVSESCAQQPRIGQQPEHPQRRLITEDSRGHAHH